MATKKLPVKRDFDLSDLLAAGYRLPSPPAADEASAEPAPPQNPGLLRSAGDMALALGQGVTGSVKSLTDLAGADNAVSRGLDSAGKGLEGLKSDQSQTSRKQHMAAIKAAEDSGDLGSEIAAYANMVWDMPGESIAQGVGSFATLGLGKAAQGLKMAQAAKAAGMSKEAFIASKAGVDALAKAQALGFKTNLGVGMLQGAGAVKGSQYEQTYNNAIAQGMAPEQAEQLAAEAQSYAKGGMQQAVGAGLGFLAAKTGPIEKLVSGQGMGAGGIMRRTVGGFGTEFATEGTQGSQERYAGNTAAIDAGVLDPSKRFAGVAGQGVSEGIVGGVLGGGAGALGGASPEATGLPTVTPGDQIRATETVPEAGPMTRAANLATEQKAQTADAQALQLGFNPLAGTPVVFPDGSVALGSEQADGKRAEDNQSANIQQLAANRPPMLAGDAVRILEEAKGRGLDFVPAPHPEGGFLVVPRNWVTPQTAVQSEAQLMETISRMQQADAAPVERAPRVRTDAQELSLNTDPVTSYMDDLRTVNTPAAKLYVRDFDAGRITPADVQQRMDAERGKSPDERLAAAAAEGLRMNPKGDPFKTLMAAQRAAKTTPGDVIEVQGGYAIRPKQEPAREQATPDAAFVQAPDEGAASALAAQPGATAGLAEPEPGVPAGQPEPQGALSGAADVQNQTAGIFEAPGTIEAAPGEAPAPAAGDAAAAAGVPAEAGSGGVQADGVTPFNVSKSTPEIDTSAEPVQETAKIEQVTGQQVPVQPSAPVQANGQADPVAPAEVVRRAFTADEATAAQGRVAQAVSSRIDEMKAQDVQRIAAKFLPTMGVKVPMGKARIKQAVTDFTKVNPLAAAGEFGVEVDDSVRGPLQAQSEGRLVDPAQQDAAASQPETETTAEASNGATPASPPDMLGRNSQPIGEGGNPYPTGEERARINAAFDKLAGTIKTKDTGKGVAMFSRRTASGNRVPDVVIGHKLGDLNRHPDYEAAKAGDSLAAARIAVDLVDDSFVQRVRDAAGNADVIVPVVSVEASGRNKIPAAVADLLAEKLGSEADAEIVQVNSPKRTAMDGLDRLLSPPVFDGPVRRGAAYVLVDDTVTQGGTFASLASHIRDNGGQVSGLVALTGKQYSATLSPSPELLSKVRERFNDIEPQFRAATGYGFDALTESEARYLVKHDDAQRVRDRIVEAGNQAGDARNASVPPRLSLTQGPAQGLSQTASQAVVDAIKARWANAPDIVVVADMQDPAIPERVRQEDAKQRSQGASGQPEGFFYKGKVYIVASALNKPADVVRVLFHETLGHYGLRGVFGDALTPILKQLAALRRGEVAAKAEEYGLNMDLEADRLQAAEEVLAVLAQTRPDLGYVKRAVAAIRAFLRKHVPGFQQMQLTDADIIQQFILPARRFVEDGGGGPRGGQTVPAFSRASASVVADQIRQFDVAGKTGNTLAHYRGMALQALGRRQLVDLFSSELPQLERYNELVQSMDAEKNDTGAEADGLARAWGNLDSDTKRPGEERRLAELMHDATLAQIDPQKDYEAGDNRAQWAGLRNQFNALDDKSKALYIKARDMYADHYAKVRQAIADRIERSELSESQKKATMAKMDDDFFKKTKGVYFPLARFGSYVMVVKDANGEAVNVSRAETLNEAETTRKELLKAFPKSAGFNVSKVMKDAEFNPGRDAVGKGFMSELFDVLDKQGADEALRDSVTQLYLSALPDLSWAKHGIHRKGTPGFSQDARRAFAQNMFHGARYLAKLRYADQLQSELETMQEHIEAYREIEEYDSVKAQQVLDEMVKRHESLMNPKTNALSTALTSVGFVFYLGISPAAAMVNLSQTALVAYPIMGAKWGFSKAGAALLRASKETVAAKNDISKVLAGDELAAYEQAVKDGTIDVTMAHDLAGISQGEDAKVTWAMRPVMRWASFLFHHAERFNRQATFVAAFRLAKDTGVGNRVAFEEAKKATYDGHFDYGASNRPRVMQGNVAKVLLLFKQYGQNMVYTLSRQAYLSMKGLSPEDRAEARKQLGGILALHAAAAGTLGLPLVGPLLAAASFLGGDEDDPWDAEVAMKNMMADAVGPKAAEVLSHGVSRLTPWDISSRVALDRLILPDVREGLEGQDYAEAMMVAAIGPVGGIFTGMAKGLQSMSEGKYGRGLEEMLPVALRNPIKAMRYAEEGAVDKSGVVIKDEVSLSGVLGQASGFAPSEVRLATEGKSAIYQHDRARMDRRKALMTQFAQAYMAGDAEGVQEVREAIARFNSKNPTRQIQSKNLMLSVRNRQRRIEEAEQGVYLPKNRRDSVEAGRFSAEPAL